MEKGKTLPKELIFDDERLKVERSLNEAINRMRSAYVSLRNIKDLQRLPKLEKITPEWLVDVIHGHIEAIENSKELTTARKEEMISDWREIQKRAQINVNIIHNLFCQFPIVKMEYDYTIKNYICTNKAEVVQSVGSHKVPEEAQEHYNLFIDVEEAINRLRAWEKERNLKKFVLRDILMRYHSPEAFARLWVQGTFTKNKFDLEPENEQSRKIYESNYL